MTIAHIIQVSWPAVVQAAHRNYKVSQVMDLQDHLARYVLMTDPATGNAVPITWTRVDEAGASEAAKINLVHGLLENGIDVLNQLANTVDNNFDDSVDTEP